MCEEKTYTKEELKKMSREELNYELYGDFMDQEGKMKCQFCGKKISWFEGIFGASACNNCAIEGELERRELNSQSNDNQNKGVK